MKIIVVVVINITKGEKPKNNVLINKKYYAWISIICFKNILFIGGLAVLMSATFDIPELPFCAKNPDSLFPYADEYSI
jgi:hypothetical protein